MLTPERYERISALFLAASDLPEAERGAFLARECAEDAELRAAVERMLAREAEALAAEVTTVVPPELRDPTPEEWGNYRILETIGSGGMGTVYRAMQLRPRRVVALKVIRADRTTPEIARRFASEAEILGSLQHPGIAQVHEAGSIPSPLGELPYIAMEWIDGLPLREHADTHALGARERLQLLARIAEAVDFAHRRGVVHRDLKPDNILVDRRGQPKVLDFGIARVTDPALRSATFQTEAGQLLGTLPYMSPEQVAGGAVDARTDVYSLGVIGYELLAGRLPHDLGDTDLESALRAIRDDLPRGLDELDPRLRGDIATIIGKALEKEPSRRYGSAAELAADIERHLADRPILARPPSSFYQLARFARRNRTLVGATLAVLLALVAGLAGTIAMALEATRERDVAREQTAVANAVNEFLELDLIRQADPESTPNRDLTVREALDAASRTVGARFADRPRVEAAIRSTIGSTYKNLGLYRPALEHLTRAQELQAALLPADDEDLLRTTNRLIHCHFVLGMTRRAANEVEAHVAQLRSRPGEPCDLLLLEGEMLRTQILVELGRSVEARRILEELAKEVLASFGAESPEAERVERQLAFDAMDRGNYEEAERCFEAGAERLRREAGPNDPTTLRVELDALACIYHSGRNKEALPRAEELLERHRTVFGPEHPRTIQVLRLVAVIRKNVGDIERAHAELGEVLALRRKVLGEDHPDTLLSMNDEALRLKNAGELVPAEEMYRAILRTRLEALDPGHVTVTNVRNNLAMLLRSARRYDEARDLLEESLRTSLEALGPDHPATLRTRYYLGFVYRNLERLDDAEREYTLALAGQEARLGLRHRDTQLTLNNLAYLHRLRGHYRTSEELYLRLLPVARESYAPGHEYVAGTLESIGKLLIDMGEPARALPYFEETFACRTASIGEEAALTQATALSLWRTLDELDRHDEALRYAARAAELLREPRGPGRAEGRHLLANALYGAGVSHVRLGAFADAETALLEAYSIYTDMFDTESKEARRAEHWLHVLYDRWGRPEDAARYRPRADLE